VTFADGIFYNILNMSVTASIAIPAVIAVRFVLKKAPKVFSYFLWAAVLFRLLCPVSVTAPISLYGPLESYREMTQDILAEDDSDAALVQSVGLGGLCAGRKRYGNEL